MNSTLLTCSTRCNYSGTLLEIYTSCLLATVELEINVCVNRHHLQRSKTSSKSTTLYSNRRQAMSGVQLLLVNFWKLKEVYLVEVHYSNQLLDISNFSDFIFGRTTLYSHKNFFLVGKVFVYRDRSWLDGCSKVTLSKNEGKKGKISHV